MADCPICGDRRTGRRWTLADRDHGTPGAFELWRCRACGHGWLVGWSTELLAAAYPADYYAHGAGERAPTPAASPSPLTRTIAATGLGYPGISGSWRHRLLGRGMTRLPRWHAACPKVLDVGCGAGDYLSYLRELGWETSGLDVAQGAVDRAREAGHEAFAGPLAAAPWPAGSFGCVTLMHSLEHLPDPLADLARVAALLAPGGELLIETPGLDSLVARLAGVHWRALDTPRHLHLFTRRSLRAAVELAGLEPVAVRRVADPSDWLLTWANCRQRRPADRPAVRSADVEARALARLPHARAVARLASLLGVGTCLAVRARRPA